MKWLVVHASAWDCESWMRRCLGRYPQQDTSFPDVDHPNVGLKIDGYPFIIVSFRKAVDSRCAAKKDVSRLSPMSLDVLIMTGPVQHRQIDDGNIAETGLMRSKETPVETNGNKQ